LTVLQLVQEQKAERRDRILATARQMIDQFGVEGVTMRGLAAASRVSVPTLYNLFGGKDELLLQAVEARFLQVVAVDGAGELDGLQRAFALFRACCQQVNQQPNYSRSIVQLCAESPRARECGVRMARTLGELLSRALNDLQREGRFAPWVCPDVLANRAIGQFGGTIATWARGDWSADRLETIIMYQLCICLLGGCESAQDRSLLQSLAKSWQPGALAPFGVEDPA
jgi:AcrR family transcriptional regulator